ncbi:MAG: hypothetical protein ABJC19_12580, partial [Gemmatimonadota bacterium]
MTEVLRIEPSSPGVRPPAKGKAPRPLIILSGDSSGRPDGLERDLLRAGFQVAEADDPEQYPGRP